MTAYQKALELLGENRAEGDMDITEVMTEIGRLADDPQVKADWLGIAFDQREAALGRGNPLLDTDREELNAVLAAAGRPLREKDPQRVRGPANFDLVDVYYATHRAETGSLQPVNFYGGTRDEELHYGVAQVSVPHDRAAGDLPRPSIWRLEFRPDPNKHMILNSVTPIEGRDSFFDRVAGVVGDSDRKEVFVFIHGFNTSFDGAAVRTAQLSVDMNLDGAPILYSWPSAANMFGYAADGRTTANPDEINSLADFLTDVANRTGARTVNLVAHSMGNRVLTRALDVIAAREDEALFNEVVMAAPDVGVDEFEDLWPRIVETGSRFTLYASQRDRALQVSELVNQMARVGDARTIVVRDGLQTVDTTAASGGMLGHTDFAGSALADFRAVMWLSLAPDRRCVLETTRTPQGQQYWAFNATVCPEAEFTEATQMARSLGSVEMALAKLNEDLSKAGIALRQSLLKKRDRLMALMGEEAPVRATATTPAE